MSVHSPKLLDVPKALKHEDLSSVSESDLMEMMETSDRTQRVAELQATDIRRKGATEGRFVPRSVLLHLEEVASVCRHNRQVLQRAKGDKKRARIESSGVTDYYLKCKELDATLGALMHENAMLKQHASGSGFSESFVEIARIVLAESTFKRIEDRAKDRCVAVDSGTQSTKVRP